jgi:very-short-patch-repair endonuclease
MTEKPHRSPPVIRERARELRQSLTNAERRLWTRLRNRQLGGHKFRRQHPIDRFIVDFYCAAQQLVVEIDGDSHAEQIDYDRARTMRLNEQGCRVLRFTNEQVYKHLDAVLEEILFACEESSPSPRPSPPRGEGEDQRQD